MSKTVSRARVWALLGLLGLLAYSPLAATQTMEIVGGQGRFVDIPGSAIGMQPGAMAVAADGYLYLNDINGKLMRLNTATGNVTALPATPGGLNHNVGWAHGIAVDSAGQAHIAARGALHRINTDGTLTNIGPLGQPGPMAFAPDGTLYIVPDGNNLVYARRPSGQFEHIAGSETAGFAGDGGPALDALLNGPEGIAVGPDGNIYVSDTGNSRIRMISASTGVITTFAGTDTVGAPTNGVPAEQANIGEVVGLTFDSSGNLYVGSQSIYRVLRIEAGSRLVSTVAGTGVFGMTGNGGPATSAMVSWPRFLALDASGNLFFSDYGSNNYHYIRRIDAATGIVTSAIGSPSYSLCGAENTPASQQCLFSPWGLAADAAGNLMVADSAGQLRKIQAGTRLMSTFRSFAPASTIAVEFDPAGNLYVATWSTNYHVHRIDAITGASTIVYSGGVISDIAIDSAGNVFLADGNIRFIHRIDAVTRALSVYVTSVYAHTLDFDPEGNLIASGNLVTCSLWRIDRVTRAVTRIAGTGTCSGGGGDIPGGTLATSTVLGKTGAFAVEPDGNILVAWSSRLYRVNRATGIISRVNPPGSGLLTTPEGVTLNNPMYMEFDTSGDLYVSNQNGGQNFVFRISGLRDPTPPVITPNISGTEGTAGWYRSNVQVAWTVSDPESAVSATTGCTSSSVTDDTNGVTFTCTATSSGGTTSQSVTIKRDTVAPTVSDVEVIAFPDDQGWNQMNVAITFNANDALSGVYTTSSGDPLIISQEGTGVTGQLIVTDFAGNSTTYTSPPFNIDLYPPTIGSSRPTPQGNDGWYTADVAIDWSVDEPISPIRSTEGCDDPVLTTDSPGTTFTCTATSAGGTLSASLTIKRDATPPTLVFGPPSPAPNASGWHDGDVSFPFTTADGTSGVASTSSSGPVVITGEGAGLTASVTVIDAAGNSASFTTPPVNIDRSTPLTVTPVIAGTLGNEGWYISDVQLSWNITGNILGSAGCGVSNVVADTAGVTFTCSVTGAHGTASNSVTLKRDATPAVLTWRPATPNANAAGWNRTNVNFPYNAPTDALSGVASVSSASPLVISTEGTGVTGSVSVTDRAGNVAVFTTAARNIDKTAPTVNIRTPLHNKVYGLYATLIADYDCTDAVSTTTSCSGTVADGATLNTRSMNSNYTFRVTSTDAAGNSVTKSNAWVVAGSFLFEGYLAPMGNDPAYNLVTAGTRVPMRFRLPDRNGGYVSDMTAFQAFNIATERCISSSVPLNDVATGGPGLSFDSATSTFTYNWDTDASWAGTCRNVHIRLIDGSRHTLYFKFQ